MSFLDECDSVYDFINDNLLKFLFYLEYINPRFVRKELNVEVFEALNSNIDISFIKECLKVFSPPITKKNK